MKWLKRWKLRRKNMRLLAQYKLTPLGEAVVEQMLKDDKGKEA